MPHRQGEGWGCREREKERARGERERCGWGWKQIEKCLGKKLDNIPKKISGLGQTAHTRWARLQYKHISSQPSSHTVTGTALTVLWWEEWQVVVMMIRAKGCSPPPHPKNRAQIKELAEEMCWGLLGILTVSEEHICTDVNVMSNYSHNTAEQYLLLLLDSVSLAMLCCIYQCLTRTSWLFFFPFYKRYQHYFISLSSINISQM